MIGIKKKYIILFLEILSLAILTLLISYFDLDIKIQRLFYRGDSTSVWFQKDNPFWRFGYHYGTLPAILLAFAAVVGLVLSWIKPRLKSWRRYFLLIILTLIIGPGLLVNAIFKDHWGRPRPRQVQEFGGKWEFKEVWEPGTPGKGKSFPCGHCSMGFFFITLYYGWKRKRRWLAYSSLIFSIAMGLFIGFARISQGGHFFSDVIWSAGLTYLTATVLYYFILKIPEHETKAALSPSAHQSVATNPRKRLLLAIAIVIALVISIFTFLFSKPFYRESNHQIGKDPIVKHIRLHFDVNRGDIILRRGVFEPAIHIKTTAQGFGFPRYHFLSNLIQQTQNDTLLATYHFELKGLFNEIDVQTMVEIDSLMLVSITGGSQNGSLFFEAPMFKSTH
ncbi:MAG: phosphatase PAP2 family protein [candidate division KSB1 bacterium]|nr:phosphatase PAP2 family protein [candidate division KSB1 bacterium]